MVKIEYKIATLSTIEIDVRRSNEKIELNYENFMLFTVIVFNFLFKVLLVAPNYILHFYSNHVI